MRGELLPLGGLLVVALVSMAVYRATPDGSSRERALAQRGSFALGAWVRAWFYWFLHPLERAVVELGLRPEVFNAGVVVLGLAAMAAYASGSFPLAGWLLLLGGLCDVFDGLVARARSLVSPFGAFLDSTLDRFHETFVFLGIALFFRTQLAMVLSLVALAGSLLVSYTRARGESLGVMCKLGVLQRAERMILLGFGSILDPWASHSLGREPGTLLLAIVALIAIGSMGTAVFRTIWISRRLREMAATAPVTEPTARSR